MAFPSPKPQFFLFYMVLLSIVFSCSVLASRASPSYNKKVELGLYYESLCPYSANFIINYLVEIFEDDDLLSIVDLHLYPWGNAKIRDNATFDCQHGPSECLLNTVEACAIDIWPELNEHFQFIYCIETLVYERKFPQWETCFEKLGLDPKPISDCYSSGYGTKLELQYAKDTISLEPPHQYVPWVVVDGQPLYEDYENFISYICKAYNGTAVPKACSNISLNTIQEKKGEATGPVCDKETKTWSKRIRSAIRTWMHMINRAVLM